MTNFATINQISECFIKPKYAVEESKTPYYLSPMDLSLLSLQYIQNGLLFKKPSSLISYDENFSTQNFLQSLKESLSLTLVHFYPLAGQFVTQIDKDQQKTLVYIDCNKGPGARFTYATASGLTVSDIISSNDVHSAVRLFFDHNDAMDYDGYFKPLLSVQVTELEDGMFVGCSMNHAVVDGTSYWHFWNIWSEIHRSKEINLEPSRLPIHSRWFPDGHGPIISLPFKHPNEFITRHKKPQLREKIFHFSSQSIAALKAKANQENSFANKISSFQALCALIWRTMVKANQIPHNQLTNCSLVINNRHRFDPPLSPYYFGNCINGVTSSTRVGELLECELGFAALLVHKSVVNHTDKALREFYREWMKAPWAYKHATLYNLNSIMFVNSPRFDMYGNEFGLGKPMAVFNGQANKATGVVNAYPGYEGGGSVDLEISLPPDSMSVLESDEELQIYIS